MFAKKSLIIMITGLALVACGGRGNDSDNTHADSTARNQQEMSADLLLIPGKSAGPFVLGQSDSLLHQQLGKPDFSNAAMGKAVLVWYTDTASSYPLSVFTARAMGSNETARIQQIRITSPLFKTNRSLHVGSTLPEISTQYQAQAVETYEENGKTFSVYDTDAGIAFEVGPDDRCVALIIHAVDAGITSYLPLREIN